MISHQKKCASIKKQKNSLKHRVKNSKWFPLTDLGPVFFSTSLVFIILLFKGIRVSNRSDIFGDYCGWIYINSGHTEYYNPCNFHARYVSLRRFHEGTVDVCEVEIYGEYSKHTILLTDFHASDSCRIKWMEMFILYTLIKKK